MATNRRRKEFSRRGDVEPLDGDRAIHLAYGYAVFGGGFQRGQLLRSWSVHGAVILEAWLERFAGSQAVCMVGRRSPPDMANAGFFRGRT